MKTRTEVINGETWRWAEFSEKEKGLALARRTLTFTGSRIEDGEFFIEFSDLGLKDLWPFEEVE